MMPRRLLLTRTGLSEDRDGNIRFDLAIFFCGIGYPDTPANRLVAEAAARVIALQLMRPIEVIGVEE